jgi:hypothetical protein
MPYNSYQTLCDYVPVTIAVGQTKSSAVNIYGNDIIGIYIPNSTLTATSLTFENSDQLMSPQDSSFAPVVESDGTDITIVCTTKPSSIKIDPVVLPSLTVLKVVANLMQATSPATIYLIVRPV